MKHTKAKKGERQASSATIDNEGMIEVSGSHAVTPEEAIAEEIAKKLQDTARKIYLTSDGDLYKKPREKYTYHLDTSTGRYKLLKFLTEKFIRTSMLSEGLDGKSEQSIRTDVKVINRTATEKLDIGTLIEGRRKSGYRINPKYLLNHL